MLNMARWQVWLVIALCVVGILYAVPNLVPRERLDALPSWLPKQQVNLGLDLQGGSHLLLEVDTKAVVRERLTNLIDAIRSEMRNKRIVISNLAVNETGDGISFRVRDRGAGRAGPAGRARARPHRAAQRLRRTTPSRFASISRT